LLILLPVFAGQPGSERLFAISALVVLLSVVLHGGGIALYVRRLKAAAPLSWQKRSSPALAPSVVTEAQDADARNAGVPERITLEELRRLLTESAPVVMLDVRTERSFRIDPVLARGALRLPPDDAVQRAVAMGLSRDATLVAYCA